MDKKQLLRRLEELHRELESARSVDDNSRDLLKTVMRDIDRVLASDEPSPTEDGDSIRDQLDKIVVQFEADHPRAAMTINEVMDALAKMGI